MRASAFFISTLKEAPADAEVISHRLMVRAGMIKKLAAGIYSYLPVGLRSIRKIENIVREEMNRAGAIELLMPVVQPAELWMESGRWYKMGPELARLKDRHERDFVIQPTSEEVIADIVREQLKSYKQLPVNFYHIQTKFRDERRPRFGLMRGREFTMKDAYSFDRDDAGGMASYRAMYDAYVRIFDRMGLTFRAVAADTGNIGGKASHEFQVIRRHRRGCDRLLPGLGLCREHRDGRSGITDRRACPGNRCEAQGADAGHGALRGRRRTARCAVDADGEVDRPRRRPPGRPRRRDGRRDLAPAGPR